VINIKKVIFFFLTVLLIFSQFVFAQQPQGKTKTYIATNNKPVQFRIYTPAKINLNLNYSQQGCNYSSYYIYQNDKLIYTTKQGNKYIPQKNDTTTIGNGFYGFKVDTGVINDKVCSGQNSRNNSRLQIKLQCMQGDCFMDPMILQMQRMQEQQRREMERMNRQNMMKNNNNNNSNSVTNHNYNNMNGMNGINGMGMGF